MMNRTTFGELDKYAPLKIPTDLAAALRLKERKERDEHGVRRRIICQNGRINLELTFGANRGENRFDIGHVYDFNASNRPWAIPVPHFLARAWNLTAAYREGMVGYVEWPSPVEIDAGADEVTLSVPVKHGPEGASQRGGEDIDLVDWQPARRDTDVFESLEMPTYETSLTGSPDSTVKGALPTQLAREMEIDDDHRLEITMDCIDGRKILFASATDKPQSEVQNSVSIYMGGPNKQSRRFTANRVASLLDVRDRLAHDSVRLKWSGYQGILMAYVAPDQ